ncbi:NADH-quinone oxidoreductase subunit NuoG [Chitinophaga tropicalis]|uniref:NADH-quinone oxidoreductase n=1 Tax=Chitinophaga tropicalis TaxID=2683588 RepID=A0A7K1U178_9BACT|nr:NADH-quinone oxidoreductase subunit NuoG [Chitinophaga tropicalis]MVT08127.1 NADH-quinone oxidoreductase subunit NuoG [Chitinophaga tropicalis]
MPTIYIDNKAFEVKAGKNLLEACLSLGLDLPYFCWHPAMGSVGACRQCAVKVFKDEEDTRGRIVMSCMESVKDGLRLSVNDKTATTFRSQVIEWLMTNHPHDCPVCDEGGCCHLQDVTVMTGHNYRRYEYKKRTYTNQYLGPLVNHEMNRCIQCYRCVRYYRDYAGGKDLNVFSAHNHVYFGREKDGVLQSPFSGNLVEVCPTGVFTDKTLKEHYTRKWDLTNAPAVCQHCSLGCNVIAGERYGQLRNIVNRYNSEVNGYFLCDKGRFGYEFVNSENRVTQPLIRKRQSEAVNRATLMQHMSTLLSGHTLIGIGSPRASLESNYALMDLVGKENFYQGIPDDLVYIEQKIVDILLSGAIHTPSLKEIEQADAVLILGEDIWNTAPVMALAVRQSVMKTAATHTTEQVAIPLWHDMAVRELVQDAKGFLANMTVTASPLDEISASTMRAAPDDLARLGFAIAHILNPSLPEVPDATDAVRTQAMNISRALQQAKHPVIITGTSCWNNALVRAAFDIAAALDLTEKRAGLAFVMQDCNSLGLAMMRSSSFEKAITSAERSSNVTAIILENDLYRSVPAGQADAFFSSCKNVVVLDTLHNRTTERADVLIPAATFAEADGTFVNNEARAQCSSQVFMPANSEVRESFKWLSEIRSLKTTAGNGHEKHPDEILQALESKFPQFKGISRSAPPHDFRFHGARIPRESHRYSGRTAMQANIDVSEPKPLQDDDSPLSYTMEGYRGPAPSPLIPFFWAPGWNSGQSVNKFQLETGGSLKGGEPGVRLAEQTGVTPVFSRDIPDAFTARQDKWLLLPQYHLFGSGELSVYTEGIASQSPAPYISLSRHDAERAGLKEGDIVTVKSDGKAYSLPLSIHGSLPDGIMLVPAGLRGMDSWSWGGWVNISTVKV